MTACAVPPPGQHPFALRDIVVHSRWNLTRGLALSAFAHVGIVAAFVLLQHGEPVVRLYEGSVTLVPSPPVFVPPAPRSLPPVTRTAGDPTQTIAWNPVDRPVIDAPTTPVVNGSVTNDPGPPGEGPATFEGRNPGAPPATDREPAEGAFVFFDDPPVPVHHPAPDYPGWAKENGISGTVLLHLLVGQDGRVRRVSVIRGVTGLTEAAQEALRRWTFRPARANGRPVAVWVEIPVEFRLGS